MNTIIALFRGINVGGKNIIRMFELKQILEDQGLKNIKTYIQSGNVVFQTKNEKLPKLEKEIRIAINKKFGFEPRILFLKQSELKAIIDANPFDAEDSKSQHFFFLDSVPTNIDVSKLNSIKSDTEKYVLDGKVFYLFAPDGIGRSKLASRVEKLLGVATTARNKNTVERILHLIT